MSYSSALTRRTVLFAPLVLAACQRGPTVHELTGETMGTTYAVVASDPHRSLARGDIASAIDRALLAVNAEMSNWDAQSELSQLNAYRGQESLNLSEGLHEVLDAAQTVHTASDGRFDIALGPLIDTWGFGAQGTRGRAPTDAQIATAQAASGQQGAFELTGTAVRKLRPSTEFHVSAIGKGHGVDRVARSLAQLGLTDFMVEIGGDLYAVGNNPDGLPWQIGIETPMPGLRSVHSVVRLAGRGMATSGDYRNYFEHDGVRYSHILDARTGRPVTHRTASATVLAENAMMADAWSTAMLVLGRERGLEIAESLGLAVFFLDRDDNGGTTQFVATASSSFQALQT